MREVVLFSLVPSPCAFVACSMKFAQSEFHTASDKRAGPGNKAKYHSTTEEPVAGHI